MNNCKDCGKKLSHTRYTRCKHCANLGKLNPMFGLHMSQQIKSLIRQKLSRENSVHWKGGRPRCIDCNKLLSTYKVRRCNTCKNIGKNNPNYINGISFITYGADFTEKLKQCIKEKYNYKCQKCNKKGTHVHHIDYNKKNNNEDNLILLCLLCHLKTNYNRDYWYAYFKYLKGDK